MRLTPRLLLAEADHAIEFYSAAFGAETLECYREEDGTIAHAALSLSGAVLAISGHAELSGEASNAQPVVLNLEVEDAVAVSERMIERGARTLIPVEVRYYGHRDGRLMDPFGVIWIISEVVEDLAPDEIERRMTDA